MAASFWKFVSTISSILAIGLFVASASAQTTPIENPGPTPNPITVQRPVMADHMPVYSMDRQVAELLVVDNHGEVAMAKLAEAKAVTPSVRQFADRMEQDHTQMLQKLRPFEAVMNMPRQQQQPAPRANPANAGARPEGPIDAGTASVPGTGTPTTPAAPGTAGTPVRAPDIGSVPTPGSVPNSSTVPTPGGLSVPSALPAPRPTNAPPHAIAAQGQAAPQASAPNPALEMHRGLDFIEVKRQIGQQCLAMATKEWDTKKPVEAEIAYIGQQIVAHEHYIATSKVLRSYASPQLQNLIDQGMQIAESHLSEAKQIMADLAQNQRSENPAASK